MFDIKCPYCGKEEDPYVVMNDGDWDEQMNDPYDWECEGCGKWYKITQIDVEVIRLFLTEKMDEMTITGTKKT